MICSEESGLIIRVADEEDRRRVLVQLTVKGLKLIESAAETRFQSATDAIACLNRQQTSQLSSLLRVVLLARENFQGNWSSLWAVIDFRSWTSSKTRLRGAFCLRLCAVCLCPLEASAWSARSLCAGLLEVSTAAGASAVAAVVVADLRAATSVRGAWARLCCLAGAVRESLRARV